MDPKNKSPIKNFMMKNCSHLIQPVSIDKPYFGGLTDSLIPTTTFSANNMLKNKSLIDCMAGTKLIINAKNNFDWKQSWVYCFIQKESKDLNRNRIYIGSSISPLRRLRHYLEVKGNSITLPFNSINEVPYLKGGTRLPNESKNATTNEPLIKCLKKRR